MHNIIIYVEKFKDETNIKRKSKPLLVALLCYLFSIRCSIKHVQNHLRSHNINENNFRLTQQQVCTFKAQKNTRQYSTLMPREVKKKNEKK